jgi:hypothetical protein
VDFANSLENGTIEECGINRRDIRIAKDIFGPNGNSLEGKASLHVVMKSWTYQET